MQTTAVDENYPTPIGIALYGATDGLDALHRDLQRRMTAWRSAHETAIHNTSALIGRIDTLIAAIERL